MSNKYEDEWPTKEGWQRDGLNMYLLHHNGDYRKGKPSLVNKFSIHVQAYPKQGGSEPEAMAIADAIAKLFDIPPKAE